MAKDLNSIEELLDPTQGILRDGSSPAQLAKKQKEIELKENEKRTKQKANKLGVNYYNLYGFPISPEALSLIDEQISAKLKVVCFYYDGENVRLATVNAENPEVTALLRELSEKLYSRGELYLISEASFKYAHNLYKNIPKTRKHIRGVEINKDDLKRFRDEINDFKQLKQKIKNINISDTITLLLAAAIKVNSSDIHIEAEEKGIIVRFRVDGILQEAAKINKNQWKKIISRLKLLSKVKINIESRPQDGRFTIFLNKEKIEVRVSFLPTQFGESVVMRLLRSSSIAFSFEQLGLLPSAYKILDREIRKPNGMILNTGPTGSGKTTTLYAILSKLNQPDVKIITLEDPIEYQLTGISQSQLNRSKDYTFANGLKSVLRQDPDIIMVGEIRDLETAEIAVQASLTGHLVLSTLHTNDSSGVIPRLLDLGVKPYFISPSLNAVIAQRLVRKVCPYCRQKHELNEAEKERIQKILAVISPKSGVEIPISLPTVYKAGLGCKHCNGLGYKGRVGIFEIFTMADNIKELTAAKAPAFKILQQAIENGMITMLQDGVLKALKGITSLSEVYRVVGKFEYIDTLYDIVLSDVIGRGIKLHDEHLKIGATMSRNLAGMKDDLPKVAINDLLYVILAAAIQSNVGDIHLEATEKGAKIRFRIDGILHNMADFSKEQYMQLLSKIKIMSGFPTNVKKASWDGRFSLLIGKTRKDCRVSIIAGGYGETVVLRLFAGQAAALKIAELGMRDYSLSPLNRSMAKTRGIIITTGPTGSGKTTTLYSILNQLNKTDVKIITIEDPIEYHLDGILQTQIDPEQGYTFTAALRYLLRQNPNIIMIGEIRDPETARIAVESSMTGHLVLSTIHANNAAGAISRLVGLGVDRQLLASSLNCMVGQRLVRKICPYCKKKTTLDSQTMMEVEKIINDIKKLTTINVPQELIFYKGSGCERCGGIGYNGRLGIFEIIEMQPEIQKVMQGDKVTDNDIEKLAISKGEVLMLWDGILKALEGITTIEEVFRVGR